MKETNLNRFYHFGASLELIQAHITIGMKLADLFAYLVIAQDWLIAFLRETEDFSRDLKDTRQTAQYLLNAVNVMMESAKVDFNRPVSQSEVSSIIEGKEELERNLEREHRNLCVFTVTPKGIYDTRLLIEQPELKFPEKIRATLPPQMLYDLKEAGRCLAFEIPTACAFHVCRGTEAVMLTYYELLAKHPWDKKKKDWKIYIEQLCVEKAPQQIINRLEEIRLLDRNAYIHPDINVTLDEAPNLFELCTNVVSLMGLEMSKLTP
jgi:hypothetical protein